MLSTLALICLIASAHILYGQAEPTVTRLGDLQLGGTIQEANSDYAPERFRGFGFYSTFDFLYHIGFETEFHQLNDSSAAQGIYERTYEVGPRYVLHRGRFEPFVKAMYGRGVFNFPAVGGGPNRNLRANVAYNIGSVCGGMDYRLTRFLTLRAAFEYQRWMGFPPHGLTPEIVDVGVAYHFH